MKRSFTTAAVAITATLTFPAALPAARLQSDVDLSLSRFSNVMESVSTQASLKTTILEEALLPPAIELEQLKVVEGVWGDTHVRYRMVLNGYPIIGTQAIAHLAQDGTLISITQQPIDTSTVPSVPRISAQSALNLALQDANWTLNDKDVTEDPALCYLYNPETQQISFVYRLSIAGFEGDLHSNREYFINAVTGEVETFLEQVRGGLTRIVYQPWHIAPFFPARGEGDAPKNNYFWDIPYDSLGHAYYFFYNRYGRDSYDGNGQVLEALVYMSHPDDSYIGWQYSPFFIIIKGMCAFSRELVYHEYSHLIIMLTSALTPSGQSGALEEAICDIFSTNIDAYTRGVVDSETWKQVYTYTSYPNNPVYSRRFDAPALLNSHPDHMSEYNAVASTHHNSTIVSHAFYLLSQGGQQASGNSTINVHGLGIDTAGAIFYNANLAYFHEGTTFAEAAAGTAQSALNLGRRETASTVAAWYAVGVIPTPWGYNNEGWKVSFTGWTFFDSGNYVYSYDYGWAWWDGYNPANGSVELWIVDKGKWVHTSAEMYPWFYDHSTQSWKQNNSGTFD